MAAHLEVHALLSAAAQLSREAVVLAAQPFREVVVLAAEPVVVFAAEPEVSEPVVVFAAVASVADVAEPPASVDIRVAFPVSAPASLVAGEVDSPGRPRSVPCPNGD